MIKTRWMCWWNYCSQKRQRRDTSCSLWLYWLGGSKPIPRTSSAGTHSLVCLLFYTICQKLWRCLCDKFANAQQRLWFTVLKCTEVVRDANFLQIGKSDTPGGGASGSSTLEFHMQYRRSTPKTTSHNYISDSRLHHFSWSMEKP